MEENSILVEWDDRYSVGIPFIDDQHKELLNQTNALYVECLNGKDAAQAHFEGAILSAVDYVKFHFSAEEKMLERVDFPEIAEHKREHEAFVKKVLEEVKNFETGKQFVPNNFVRFLKAWILTHIAVSDKRYSAYIFELKKQGTLKGLTT